MKVAIEADERAIAQLPRVEVVVFDVVGHEAAADRAAGLENGGADLLLPGIRTPDLEPRRTRHAVPQRAHGFSGDPHGGHAEELQLLERAAIELLDDGPGLRPLDLKSPDGTGHGLAHGAHR